MKHATQQRRTLVPDFQRSSRTDSKRRVIIRVEAKPEIGTEQGQQQACAHGTPLQSSRNRSLEDRRFTGSDTFPEHHVARTELTPAAALSLG
jgi:hypothetical protein